MDAPFHFHSDKKMIENFTQADLIKQSYIIDISEKCEDSDY